MGETEMHITSQTPLISALFYWEKYLADLQRSKYTVKSFSGDIRLLADFFSPDKPVGSFTTQDLSRFLEWVQTGRGRGISCSPKSYARRVTTLKSFFRWLKQHGRIENDPAESLVQRTVISPIPEVLTQAEESKLEDSALTLSRAAHPDTRPQVMFLLLLETGIKKSECLNLTFNHIGFDPEIGNYIFVRYSSLRDRNKERKIPVSQKWLEVLEMYKAQYQPKDTVFPWSPRRLEYILEDLGKAAGLSKHVSFSMCRWTCALRDLEKGVESNAIRQKMGVSKIQWRELRLKLEKLVDNH